MGGVARLQEFQRCEKIDQLEDNLNAWESLLNEHAKELLHCPTLLRNLVLGLIPSDIEDYIAARPGEFQDYQSILAHARVQTVYRRTRTLLSTLENMLGTLTPLSKLRATRTMVKAPERHQNQLQKLMYRPMSKH